MKRHIFRNSGFTLIEITLVLGLTLGLAAALIFGLSAFQQGADRAKCLLNIANVQKAVRSLQNLNELRPGDVDAKVLNNANLWGGPDSFLSSKPVCPRITTDTTRRGEVATGAITVATTGYDYTTQQEAKFPDIGVAYITCKSVNVSATYAHKPKDIDGVRQK